MELQGNNVIDGFLQDKGFGYYFRLANVKFKKNVYKYTKRDRSNERGQLYTQAKQAPATNRQFKNRQWAPLWWYKESQELRNKTKFEK